MAPKRQKVVEPKEGKENQKDHKELKDFKEYKEAKDSDAKLHKDKDHKEFKDIKEIKEAKDTDAKNFKDKEKEIDHKPGKEFKDIKEYDKWIGENFPVDPGGPVEGGITIARLARRVANLEAILGKAQRPVRTKEHPAVGKKVLPRDLSRPGWRYQPGQVESSVAAADGELIPARQISGVLTRLGSIPEDELIEIAPADREYVAREMNAFLLAWLSALRCPMLNRPGNICLSGPNWRPEQWAHAASQAGVPVVPARRHVPNENAPSPVLRFVPPVTVTVVGKKCFGSEDNFLQVSARRIACHANVELLAVTFAGSGKDARFLSANLWPNISAPDVADAVQEHLLGRSRHSP